MKTFSLFLIAGDKNFLIFYKKLTGKTGAFTEIVECLLIVNLQAFCKSADLSLFQPKPLVEGYD